MRRLVPARRSWAPAALAVLCLALPALRAAAQGAPLPAQSAAVEGFVPPGWVIEQQQRADLNGDGLADVVLLLRRNDASAVTAASGDKVAMNTNPRQLAVLEATRAPQGFALAGASDRLIPRTDQANLEDPLADGEIIAQRGKFEVKLALLAGQGSYASRVVSFTFRLEPGCVRLVRYLRMDTQRATLATHDLRVDYLSGQIERASGNAQTEAQQVKREQMVPSPPQRCLPSLPSAWEFEPP